MSNLKAAIEYHKQGYHPIPIKQKDKRPYVLWEIYQKEQPLIDEIDEWWHKWPDANIGLITGETTNLVVVDVDNKAGEDKIRELAPGLKPHTKSPNGYHFWFDYHPGLTNKAMVSDGIDVRTNGGYIIAPPGKNENGGEYKIATGGAKHDSIPDALYSILKGNSNNSIASILEGVSTGCPQESTTVHIDFKSGGRDQSIFHLANHLVRGGMPKQNILKYLEFFAKKCEPPFPEKEIYAKIQSAIDRFDKGEKATAEIVKDYVLSTHGHFLSTDVQNCLQLSTRQEKKNLSTILARFVEDGLIERVGNRNGQFRRKLNDAPVIDIFDDDEKEPLDIIYPLGLHELYKTMEKTIVVVAGSQNSGKTTFMLNMALINNNRGHDILYATSEMGKQELISRLKLFNDAKRNDWKGIEFRDCSENFQDYIKPDGINIIDYLEISDAFYQIAERLKNIYDRLKTGIAVIALQKDAKQKEGRGGSFSKEKPRLYITLDSDPPQGGVARIVKCKNYKNPAVNPNNMTCNYKIRQGSDLSRVISRRHEHKEENNG